MIRSTAKYWALIVFTVSTLSGASVRAQGKAELLDRLDKHVEVIQKFTWTRVTMIYVKGESKGAIHETVGYDENGQLQVTGVDQTEKMEDSKTAELFGVGQWEDIRKVLGIVMLYAQPDPTKLRSFLNQAWVLEGGGPSAGMVTIKGSGFATSRDFVAMKITGDRLREMDVKTTYAGEQLNILVRFGLVALGGPTHVKSARAAYPKKNIAIEIENIEYQEKE
jgi:hypothetical protein